MRVSDSFFVRTRASVCRARSFTTILALAAVTRSRMRDVARDEYQAFVERRERERAASGLTRTHRETVSTR